MNERQQPRRYAASRATPGPRYSHIPPVTRNRGNTYRAPGPVQMGNGRATPMEQDGYIQNQRAVAQSRRQEATQNAQSAYIRQNPNAAARHRVPIDFSLRDNNGFKVYIGAWVLGETLGTGSSATVKICEHRSTKLQAACKIVSKDNIGLIQTMSLANLDRVDAREAPRTDGQSRVPLGIEREVAILKLIQHPNIMKLYDIWENRTHMYLVLELVDNGDLFGFIKSRGPLPERTAIFFFRQIMSAMAYCHKFNICHRDLKPENILVTRNGQIKIADFGMAAMHQYENHKLVTACGSPHYAAPEISSHYNGFKSDIWSMGIILFAMLSASLPFNGNTPEEVMARSKRGVYKMPQDFSPEAKDFMQRIIVLDPEERISMEEMARHPLITKYAIYENLDSGTSQSPEVNPRPLVENEIDNGIFRQLRTLWYEYQPEDMVNLLTSPEPNDQQSFYWLLKNYRERQLEDFKPEIVHSQSDYHYFSKPAWKRKASTCEFNSGRNVSRFTVISHVTDGDGIQNNGFEPYNPNKVNERLKNGEPEVPAPHAAARSKNFRREESAARLRKLNGTMTSIRTARSTRMSQRTISMASMHSSKSVKYGHARKAVVVHKRPVNFHHARRRSSVKSQNGRNKGLRGGRQGAVRGPRPLFDDPRKACETETEPEDLADPVAPTDDMEDSVSTDRNTILMEEDVRRATTDFALRMDNALSSSIITDGSGSGTLYLSSPVQSENLEQPNSFTSNETTLVHDSVGSMTNSKGCDAPIASPNIVVINKSVNLHHEESRRMVTAPADMIHSNTNVQIFDSDAAYMEGNNDRGRNSSAPMGNMLPTPKKGELHGLINLEKTEKTIRVVDSPRRPSTGYRLMDRVMRRDPGNTFGQESQYEDAPVVKPSRFDHVGKAEEMEQKQRKMSWLQRLSGHSHSSAQPSLRPHTHSFSSEPEPEEPVNGFHSMRKRYGIPAWKNSKTKRPEADIVEVVPPTPTIPMAPTTPIAAMNQAPSAKQQDQVYESWMTRMFRIKPAVKDICVTMSDKQSREFILELFNRWKSAGLEDYGVHPHSRHIYATVSSSNKLKAKGVSFRIEIHDCVEHGSRTSFSILRCVQESGAASTFHIVVKTIKYHIDEAHRLVEDRQKASCMVQTLNQHTRQATGSGARKAQGPSLRAVGPF